MWALRRAAIPSSLWRRSQSVVIVRACCATPEVLTKGIEPGQTNHVKEHKRPGSFCAPKLCPREPKNCACALLWSRNLSSQAGTKSSDKEDDPDDESSDLEVPRESANAADIEDNEGDEELSEGELSEEDSDEDSNGSVDLSGELKIKKRSSKKIYTSALYKAILEGPRQNLSGTLDKWVEEGNALGRHEISNALLYLRKRRLYSKALQLMEWLLTTKRLDFTERDYASLIDLVGKVHGLHRAEKYMEKIPESYRGELAYRTLLANCVASLNVNKAEEVFNKIKDIGYPLTTFACNQLLLLYRRLDRKKIADVLLMMEKENIKPSLFTYKLLIDTKGSAKDITGMEQIMDTMKAEGVKPDLLIQAIVAKHYIFAGLYPKAKATLMEMEGEDIKENRAACKALLPLYAALGQADDVGRVWKVCEANPRLDECLAVIEAWSRLGKVEKAEEVFENMFKTWKNLSSKYYNAMLKVYAYHKMLSKGKVLAKRMSDDGCKVGPMTLDALVKLYVQAGEVEKADSILHKATQQNQIKPQYSTCIALLESYAKRGDIHDAEKIFHRLRQFGYVGRMKQYQYLLQAYISAKTPAYGFKERMKADNVFPNKAVAAQLAVIDAFKKTQMSELLD